ncbi:DsbA family oxidoreductase [Solibacillus sp. A46]|uniref:DsbA family oxidoreductase n=1 Tax=Solibacillus faecavium TaxID=2762221 RepID=A0ABR8XWS1_9BACL|nr:DsbA family oxidoreductase [Solibacillus faecavium]MBD8036390.1 DsbA family oxidoreductase [Solibacillus faecavium]
MQIEVFSDFSCPFCYIAKKKLFQAIEQLNLTEEVVIEYKAYELNPQASKTTAFPYVETLIEKKNNNRQKVDEIMESITMHGNEVGVTFNFQKVKLANTKSAHRLSKLAKTYSKENEFVEIVMDRYFTEGLNLNDEEELLAICEEIGLDRNEAHNVMEYEQYSEQLAMDRYEAQQLQITSIPFFVFENRYGIQGVEPLEVFTKTLLQAKALKE